MIDFHSKKLAARGRPIDESARAERRRQIVEAALNCFAQKGFHATSTAELSAEAGISVAGLYQYFPTKSDLIHALIDYGLESDLLVIRRLDDFDDFYEGLVQLGDFIAQDETTLRHCRLRMEITAEAGRDPAVAAKVLQTEKQVLSALIPLIHKEQEKGTFAAELNTDMAAQVILSFFDGLLQRLTLPLNSSSDFVRVGASLIERALSRKTS